MGEESGAVWCDLRTGCGLRSENVRHECFECVETWFAGGAAAG